MLKQVYKIDSKGYLVDIYVAEIDDNGFIVDEDKKGFLTTDLPQGYDFIRPRWYRGKWVEGATQDELDERDAERLMQALVPTPEQVADSELEIKILSLLIDMEVI